MLDSPIAIIPYLAFCKLGANPNSEMLNSITIPCSANAPADEERSPPSLRWRRNLSFGSTLFEIRPCGNSDGASPATVSLGTHVSRFPSGFPNTVQAQADTSANGNNVLFPFMNLISFCFPNEN